MHPTSLNYAHDDYLHGWQDAMRFGLMGGRPFSEICIRTYAYYTEMVSGAVRLPFNREPEEGVIGHPD